MTFLRLNGWTIPVADQSADRSEEVLGEYGRSYGGRPSTRRQAIARRWGGRAFPVLAEDADTLSGLLEGRGHRWGYDRSLYSSAGLGPEAGFDEGVISFEQTTDIPVPYCLRLDGEFQIYDANLPRDWTALYYYSSDPLTSITNYVTQSERLLLWTSSGISRGYVSEGNPIGGPRSTSIVESAVLSTHSTYQDLTTLSAGVIYTASIYVKAAGRSRGRIAIASTAGTDSVFQDFDLDSGTVTATSASGTGSILNWNVIDVGDGWFRVLVTGTFSAAITGRIRVYILSPTGFVTYTGDGASGLLIWGGQLVNAGTETRYIPTAGFTRTLSLQRSWEHRTIRSDGAKWINGVRFDALTPTEFGVDNGAAVIQTGAFADLVLLPFQASESAILAWYSWISGQTGPKTISQGRGFSDLPRLDAWGDMLGDSDPVEVLAVSSSEAYVQHGAKDGSGWRNNSREIPLALEEVSPREEGPTLPFRADLAFLLDDRITGDSYALTNRRPLVGDAGEASLAVPNPYLAEFPFADFQVRTWPSASSSWAESSSDSTFAGVFEGASAVSMVAFVRRGVLSTQQTIAMFEIGTNSSHFGMDILATNRVRIGGRSRATDSFQSLQVSIANVLNVSPDAWIVVGGYLDFANAELGAGFVELGNTTGNDELGAISSYYQTGPGTFGSTRWIDSGVDLRIGIDVGLANSWRGEIAYVGFIRNHRVTESELREAFAAFRAGRYR